jgi:hypothetical protein
VAVDGSLEYNGTLSFTQNTTRYNVPMLPSTIGQYALPIVSAANSNVMTSSSSLTYNTVSNLLNLGASLTQQPASGSGYSYLVIDASGNVKREANLQYITVKNATISTTTAGSTAIPASPVSGDAYVIPTGANIGAWASFTVGNVATWNGSAWVQTVVALNNAVYTADGITSVVTSTSPITWTLYGTSSIDGANVLPEAWSLGGNTNNSQFGLGNINSVPLNLITGGSTRMTIAGNNAYVGIGTSSPA